MNCIQTLPRDCYHAGIPHTDAEISKRAIRGGSNHHFYAASYQQFDANIRRAELNNEEVPPFAELESHLLNIDKSRGLTLPSQNQQNYNQHANSVSPSFSSHTSQPCQGTRHIFISRQQQAFISRMRQSGHHSNPTFDQTIRPLPNQDKRITMITDLKHTKLALFNNRTEAQDHPSDQLHPTIQTTDALQTITMLQDDIPAHPMQQIFYASTAEA